MPYEPDDKELKLQALENKLLNVSAVVSLAVTVILLIILKLGGM